MSFFSHRNPFLLALMLSLVVLGQTATPPPAVHENIIGGFFPKVKVEMFNMLPNKSDLTLHCKSKDDDLKAQQIRAGSSYGFEFKVNFQLSTLFFCTASWKGGNVVFDIYDTKRDLLPVRCVHYCKWVAKRAYIFGYNQDDPTAAIVVHWSHQP